MALGKAAGGKAVAALDTAKASATRRRMPAAGRPAICVLRVGGNVDPCRAAKSKGLTRAPLLAILIRCPAGAWGEALPEIGDADRAGDVVTHRAESGQLNVAPWPRQDVI